MGKRNECDIVQDLLLNYVDDVLNPTTKELAEEHLKICTKCQEKLKEIQEDRKQEEKEQKKEIDYLKKIKRKARMKSILLAIGIIAILGIGWYTYKLCIITSLSDQAYEHFEKENFYLKVTSNLAYEEDKISINELWYKEGNYKKASYIESIDGSKESFYLKYGEIDKREFLEIQEQEKIATKVVWPIETTKENLVTFPNPMFRKEQLNFRLGTPFSTQIGTDTKEIGREYYVLRIGESKLWVDKETGLPIMSFGYSTSTQYYGETKIPRKTSEEIKQYEYTFDTVTEEDIAKPDLSNYQIEVNDYFSKINE